jgi:hypothetical protein
MVSSARFPLIYVRERQYQSLAVDKTGMERKIDNANATEDFQDRFQRESRALKVMKISWK